MKSTRFTWTALACATLVASQNLAAQSVERLVDQAGDGFVRMTFTPKPTVCGDDGRVMHDRGDLHWEYGGRCSAGPVHVLLTKDGGRITHVKTYVGGRWRTARSGTTDIGRIAAPDAADYLIDVARREPAGHRAIMPATLADSTDVWPELIEMAQDPRLPERTQKQSMQWLGMLAGQELPDDDNLDPEREWRRQAVFALSQLPRDEGIPRLIDLAQTHRYGYVKRLALFWLGQSGDTRAIPVIRGVLQN